MPHLAVAPPALAVDIGGTKIAVRAEERGVSWTVREEWTGSDPVQLAAILTTARHRLQDRIGRVAVACPPSLDPTGRVTSWPSRPDWIGVPLRHLIVSATATEEVVFADDGSLAALVEAETAGCADLAYIGLGTGVGGGLVCGGRLLSGFDGTAGEIGHLVVDPLGPECGCGRKGCLQALASGPALQRRAGELRGRPTTTIELVSAVGAGRPWALQVRNQVVEALAAAITVIDELVRPARVHLGGGLGHALPGLPSHVTARLGRRRRPGRPSPAVAAASGRGEESLAGAMLLAHRGDLVPRLAA